MQRVYSLNLRAIEGQTKPKRRKQVTIVPEDNDTHNHSMFALYSAPLVQPTLKASAQDY